MYDSILQANKLNYPMYLQYSYDFRMFDLIQNKFKLFIIKDITKP